MFNKKIEKTIVEKHFILSLEEIVKYELLLCFSPFDVSNVSLFSEKEKVDINIMLDIAYYYYGEKTVEEYTKKHISVIA